GDSLDESDGSRKPAAANWTSPVRYRKGGIHGPLRCSTRRFAGGLRVSPNGYPSSATFTNDSQNRFGASHRAYLDVWVVGPPVSLRHVDDSPVLGLLRRLRRRGTRVP